ncbi:phosphate ABC transporter substrate-binding protein PstS [Euzebya sp.]|uniref:phosphate ABC transporter substrate-binding protein PstS n=1 Tax=Euzebya sp. TaxID=1971409 RepID=UPI003511D2F7
MRLNWRLMLALTAVLAIVATGCASNEDDGGTDEGTTGQTEEGAAAAGATESGGDLAGTIVGAGASSQAAAMEGWQAGFQSANPGVTVNYDPVGSGGGREQFLAGATMFAGSDAYLDAEEIELSAERCPGGEPAINLPHYISPVAVAFNLEGIDTLNMSPDVIGGIFAATITSWDDPAIAEDNPDVELPDLPINPVHRSDDSGTTENFTGYLDAVAPDAWPYGEVETWPSEAGGEGAPQTSGVVQAVTAGNGSIGYMDASQIQDLGTVAVGVGEDFVPFSAEAAAAVVDVSPRAEDRAEGDFAIELARDTTESGVYPIVLVSYHIVCQAYEDAETVELVTAFMEYVGSEEGQQAAAESAGSAPISEELRAEIADVLSTIEVAS